MSFIAGLLFLVVFILLFGVFFVIALVSRGAYFLRRLFFPNSGPGQHQQTDSSQSYRQTQTRDGITIIDQRSPEDSQKKIFAPDEGEYVEYREE